MNTLQTASVRRIAKFLRMAGLAVPVLIAACASSSPGRDGPPSGEARADARRPMVRPIGLVFATMDTDRDHLVSREEALTGIAAEWAAIDQDESGVITPIELSFWGQTALGSAETLPNRISFDSNLDSAISREEFDNRMVLEFDQLDKDSDGSLSRADLLVRLRAPVGSNRQSGSGGNSCDSGARGSRRRRGS